MSYMNFENETFRPDRIGKTHERFSKLDRDTQINT